MPPPRARRRARRRPADAALAALVLAGSWLHAAPGPAAQTPVGPPPAVRPSWSWSRRRLLSALVPLLGQGSASARAEVSGVAEELRRELRGEAPVRSPGESWDLRRFLPEPNPVARGQQLAYPGWLEGTWNVSARFIGASEPEGKRYVTDQTPGVRQGTLLPLPNVGQEPSFQQRYLRAPEGAVEDRAFNAKQLMEAFLPAAVVQRVDYNPEKDPTRLSVGYSTPGKAGGRLRSGNRTEEPPRVKRALEVFVNNRAGEMETDDVFVCMELFRQSNLEVGRSGDYKKILRLKRASGDEVLGQLRVGVFLTPVDPAYFDLGGKAVAVYDYSWRMSRLPPPVRAPAPDASSPS